jgi:hypothetical protein
MKMKTRSFLASTIALALTAFTGSTAMAVDNTFAPPGSSGAWNTASNWSLNQVPTAAQNVVVPSGKTCNLDTSNGVADSLDIAGDLNINGVTLTIDGSSDSSHAMSGTLDLDSSGVLRFVDNNPSFAGGGSVTGGWLGVGTGVTIALPQASIDLLPESIDVEGTLNINSGAWGFVDMENDGTVNIESSATVSFSASPVNNGLLDVNGVLDFGAAVTGSSNGEFKANGGEIEFSAASTSLTGHFYVLNGGLLDIKDNVVTTGDLKQFADSGSQIIVAAGKHFQTS